MPVYEFECLKCQNQFIYTLVVGEYEKKARGGFRCPKCHTRRVEQLIGAKIQTAKKS